MEAVCCVTARRGLSGPGPASRSECGDAFLGSGVAAHVDLDFVDLVTVRRVVVGSLPGVVGECGVVHLVDEQRAPLLSGIGDCRAVGGCGCGLRGEECDSAGFRPEDVGAEETVLVVVVARRDAATPHDDVCEDRPGAGPGDWRRFGGASGSGGHGGVRARQLTGRGGRTRG